MAQEIAHDLNMKYVKRNKQSVQELKHNYQDDLFVVGKNRIEYHLLFQESPLFFHPNSAMFRVKRLMKGDEDPFCSACNLKKGTTLLDCTLGLGSDSIVASFFTGSQGVIKGIEANEVLAYIVRKGLKQWETGVLELDYAMKRIEVVHNDHFTFLQMCSDNTYDVVYFDPMFEEAIESSEGLNPLRGVASYNPLSIEIISEAKRVAKKRVVLKDHWKSERFEQLGFEVFKRKSAKFHYGVIEISN
ncbi:hypothetical protein J2S19_000097 [Metabacillus malikii]|uniref:SAM-dependent methyltransferase n=2 Tax=Metabacillus malikii TaxID=1504265 RepID=A0ABT9ZAH5_9BACI|nr:hypothetical protein [Metabacillus malikii]